MLFLNIDMRVLWFSGLMLQTRARRAVSVERQTINGVFADRLATQMPAAWANGWI